jgi:large subunit ribosomal protein L46
VASERTNNDFDRRPFVRRAVFSRRPERSIGAFGATGVDLAPFGARSKAKLVFDAFQVARSFRRTPHRQGFGLRASALRARATTDRGLALSHGGDATHASDVAMLRALAARARRASAAAPRQALTSTSASSESGGLASAGSCRGRGGFEWGFAGGGSLAGVSFRDAGPRGASFVRRYRGNARGTRPRDVRVADRPLIANMIVERLPVVTPAPEAWEVEYQSWSAERRAKFLRELPEDLVDPKGEFEELQDPEESKFVPASRTTEADASGDTKTLRRKLDQFLFLVVQDAATKQWGFPKEANPEDGVQTMRATAKAAMDACVGDSIETFLVGNAPAGHWPEPNRGGGTNFYHRAQWLEGDLRLTEKYSDFKWLTKVRRGRGGRGSS